MLPIPSQRLQSRWHTPGGLAELNLSSRNGHGRKSFKVASPGHREVRGSLALVVARGWDCPIPASRGHAQSWRVWGGPGHGPALPSHGSVTPLRLPGKSQARGAAPSAPSGVREGGQGYGFPYAPETCPPTASRHCPAPAATGNWAQPSCQLLAVGVSPLRAACLRAPEPPGPRRKGIGGAPAVASGRTGGGRLCPFRQIGAAEQRALGGEAGEEERKQVSCLDYF